jgi:hypothetical protein
VGYPPIVVLCAIEQQLLKGVYLCTCPAVHKVNLWLVTLPDFDLFAFTYFTIEQCRLGSSRNYWGYLMKKWGAENRM